MGFKDGQYKFGQQEIEVLRLQPLENEGIWAI